VWEAGLDEISTGEDNDASSPSSESTATTPKTPLTKGVDIFAFGCFLYYTLTATVSNARSASSGHSQNPTVQLSLGFTTW